MWRMMALCSQHALGNSCTGTNSCTQKHRAVSHATQPHSAQHSGHGAGASTTANPQPKPHSLPYLAGTEVIYNSQSPPGWWCLHRTPCSRQLTAPERGWQLQQCRGSWQHQRMCSLEGCTRGWRQGLSGSPVDRRAGIVVQARHSRRAHSLLGAWDAAWLLLPLPLLLPRATTAATLFVPLPLPDCILTMRSRSWRPGRSRRRSWL